MDLATLQKRHGRAVSKMDVAAPVDLLYLFRGGLEAVDTLSGKRLTRRGEAGLHVATDVRAGSLTSWGHAIWVEGDVEVGKLTLYGSMVVMGNLTAKRVYGSDEPYTLTVMGAVKVDVAVMANQFIMQFLGGGRVGRLVDDEGGAEELIALWRDAGSTVTVKSFSDAE
jgi:hypothetical protein